jgi:molybdenum cofactor cytidylyltransferase
MTINLLILAAGASRRFGGQAKQLLPLAGQPLLRQVVGVALAAGLSGTVSVVLGANAEPIEQALRGLPVRLVDNPDWATGMASSLQAGLRAMMTTDPLANGLTSDPDKTPAGPDAVLVLLCDQPLITSQLLRDLVQLHTQTGQPMVACRYNGEAGVPALFARSVFADLLALTGDKGARFLLRNRPADLALLDFAPAAVDLDSWADVTRWQPDYPVPLVGD